MHALLGAALLLGGLVHTAISNLTGAAVVVSVQGTAGPRIEGNSHELAISNRDGELVLQVTLTGVDTGIGLRKWHNNTTGDGPGDTFLFALALALRLAAGRLCRLRGAHAEMDSTEAAPQRPSPGVEGPRA